MPGMLEGIRVLEVGHVVAIPSTGALFSDWGAEVIKVEPLNGEYVRGSTRFLGVDMVKHYAHGDMHLVFELFNRGKKGLAVDARTDRGREILGKLIASADVLLTNYEVGALRGLHLDYDTVRQINPRIIYALLTAYGSQGPDKDERGFDYAVWARAGLPYLLGTPDGPPPPSRPGIIDGTAGVHVAAGVLGALLYREKTGIGQALEFSLYQSAIWTIGIDIQASLVGSPLPRDDRLRASNPLYNTYRTKDGGWFQFVMTQADSHWPGFCMAIERPDLIADPRFDSLDSRMENRDPLIAIISAAMASRTAAEWEPIMRAHNFIYGRLQSPAEVVDDPQALANDFFVEIDHPAAGRLKLVASPVKMTATPAEVKGPGPEVGQHTEELLLELGYSWDDIADLQRGAVIR